MPSLQEQGICTICKKPYLFCSGCEQGRDDFDNEEVVRVEDLYDDTDIEREQPFEDPEDWTDEDEEALGEYEEQRRRRITEQNEY